MSEHSTEQTAVRRLERSRSDRMLAGVSAGLARYFDLSPTFYRVGFVVLTLLGGAGILIYLAAALVIPEEGKADSIAAEILRGRRERPWQVVGLGLVAVAGTVLLSRATLWPQGDAAWTLLLIVGGIILLTQRRRRKPSAVTIADGTQAQPHVRRNLLRPLAITVSVLLVVVLAAAAITATVFHVDVRNGIGKRTYVPQAAADVHHKYKLGIGDLNVDLANVEFPAGETKIDSRVGIGNLVITVPSGVAVRVKASAQIGEARVFDRQDGGRNAGVKVEGNGRRVLILDAKVGLGNVQVKRSVR